MIDMIAKTALIVKRMNLYLYRDAQKFHRPASLKDVKVILRTHALTVKRPTVLHGTTYMCDEGMSLMMAFIKYTRRSSTLNCLCPISLRTMMGKVKKLWTLVDSLVNFSCCLLRRCSQEQACFMD